MDALEQMMGAYFHQDWDIDGGHVSDTVAAFLNEPRVTVTAAADQIDELIRIDLPEDELASRLGEMGCQYRPGDADADYRQWLLEIHDQLRAFLASSAAF